MRQPATAGCRSFCCYRWYPSTIGRNMNSSGAWPDELLASHMTRQHFKYIIILQLYVKYNCNIHSWELLVRVPATPSHCGRGSAVTLYHCGPRSTVIFTVTEIWYANIPNSHCESVAGATDLTLKRVGSLY